MKAKTIAEAVAAPALIGLWLSSGLILAGFLAWWFDPGLACLRLFG